MVRHLRGGCVCSTLGIITKCNDVIVIIILYSFIRKEMYLLQLTVCNAHSKPHFSEFFRLLSFTGMKFHIYKRILVLKYFSFTHENKNELLFLKFDLLYITIEYAFS